jgi:transcriptional regulator with XRE-family HTH domain
MSLDTAETTEALSDQRALGRALRELRKRAGITQDALAARAGTDDTYISRVEHGRIGVRWHTIMRLLRALEVSLSDLAGEIDAQDPD